MLYLAPGVAPILIGQGTYCGQRGFDFSQFMIFQQLGQVVSYPGNWFSYCARKLIEKVSLQKILGMALVLAIFSSNVFSGAWALINEEKTFFGMPDKDVPQETTTKESFRPPLESFIYSQGFSQYHWGIDLAAPEGNPVYPITKGIVLEVGQSLFGYGKYILIDHQNGYRSLYAHLQKQEVGAGDFVFSQEIGKAGHTGWASGDHLHLEVYNDGLPIDPSAIISTPLQE